MGAASWFGLVDLSTDLASDWHIRRADLKSEAGWKLDYGRDSSAWSAAQAADVERAVDAAIRWILWPHLAMGSNGQTHEWSWLRPVTTLATVADQSDYRLPATFGGFAGGLTYQDSNTYGPIAVVSEFDIRRLRMVSTTGYPRYAGLQLESAPNGNVQRWNLLFYPTPDGVYTIEFRYQVLAEALSSSNPWLPGDASMAEIYLAATRAACERIILGEASGIEATDFVAMLSAAVVRDKRSGTPDYFGMMRDGGRRDPVGMLKVHGITTNTATYTPS